MIYKPGLYVVSTPIGNLHDITLRAVDTLRNSTIILCEDTRISRKLLAKHDVKAKLQLYNDHSNEHDRYNIRKLIDNGEIISLISDAGTPLISDPGYKLIVELKKFNYYIDVVPGVSSVITALTISGLPSDRFFFAGFLPKTTEGRKKLFTEISSIKATLIFFETASRLKQSLHSALSILGDREISVARELTKLHQDVQSGRISEIINFYQKNILKGEIVLLISGAEIKIDQENLEKKLYELVNLYLCKGWSAKTVKDVINENYNKIYSKKEIYYAVNKIKEQKE